MGFLKKLAGILGLGRDEGDDRESTGVGSGNGEKRRSDNQPKCPSKGFGVPVQVAVERSNPGPVLLPCSGGDGGVQGFGWYSSRLRVDEDGDVADEFLEQVLPEQWTNLEDQDNSALRLEVKHRTGPAQMRGLMLSPDGKLHQYVKHQGRLLLV